MVVKRIMKQIFLIKQLLQKVDILDKSNKEILSKMNKNETKTTTNFNEPLVSLGPRLQKLTQNLFN